MSQSTLEVQKSNSHQSKSNFTMARKDPDYDWRRVDEVWEEGEVRAPTLKREQPKRTKRRTKNRAPEIPIVEELANGEFSVTIGPPVTTTTREDFPVVLYQPIMQDMHPLTQEMQDRQLDIEYRAMREARSAAERNAEIDVEVRAMRAASRAREQELRAAREAQNNRPGNLAQGQQIIMMPATILGLLKANWTWVAMIMLVLLVAILSYIIGKDKLQPNKD